MIPSGDRGPSPRPARPGTDVIIVIIIVIIIIIRIIMIVIIMSMTMIISVTVIVSMAIVNNSSRPGTPHELVLPAGGRGSRGTGCCTASFYVLLLFVIFFLNTSIYVVILLKGESDTRRAELRRRTLSKRNKQMGK